MIAWVVFTGKSSKKGHTALVYCKCNTITSQTLVIAFFFFFNLYLKVHKFNELKAFSKKKFSVLFGSCYMMNNAYYQCFFKAGGAAISALCCRATGPGFDPGAEHDSLSFSSLKALSRRDLTFHPFHVILWVFCSFVF